MKLTIELNSNKIQDPKPFGNTLLITPPLDEDFWLMRVKVSKNQAIVCFPKFGTVGIGFQKEDNDWNTNLPWCCATDKIWNHIKKNKGRGPKDADCVEAIKMLQQSILDRNLDSQSKFNPFINPS